LVWVMGVGGAYQKKPKFDTAVKEELEKL